MPTHTHTSDTDPFGDALVAAEPEPDEPACVLCGCTEDRACPGGCSWVPNGVGEDICSACVDNLIALEVERQEEISG